MADPASMTATAASLVFLGAAVIAVPLFRYAGLSAVLGYLVAGLAIGPSGLALFQDPKTLQSIAELGIVMFLFVIGLELKPSKLASMRRDILGLGAAHLLLVMAALAPAFWYAGMSGGGIIAASFAFALSATAIALQLLNERGAFASNYGQKTFSVLLFQDMATVPFIAAMPFLSARFRSSSGGMEEWLPDVLIAIGALGALVLAGRFLLNPLFRLLAKTDSREVMTAAALLVVLGAAEAMHAAKLSMALGAFVAGLLLAESNFRHQLEADIEPFRGLLLGLFFISVGMSLDATVILANLWIVLGGTFGILALKFALTYALLHATKQPLPDAARAAILLATAGEFAFVIVPLGLELRLFSTKIASILAAIAALTLFFGPLLAKGLEPILAWRAARRKSSTPDYEEDFEGADGEVLVIGFGRFGQIVNQMFLAVERNVTVIDRNIDRIKSAERFGFKVYYGDGRRLDVLRACGAEKAAVIAVCVDDKEAASQIAEIVVRAFPQAKVFVRAYDRIHAIDLMNRGIRFPFRETFDSALAFGRYALVGLGVPEDEADSVRDDIRRRDIARLLKQRDGDINSGRDLLHGGNAVMPEPLSTPRRKGEDISARGKASPLPTRDDGVTGESS